MVFRISSLLLACGLVTLAQASENLALHLPEAPPLSFQQHASGHGIAGDMALAAIKEAGLTVSVVSIPWARAQHIVAVGQDLLITPLSRTPEREEHYTWIAPIMPLERAFFSLTPAVSNFAQARSRYRRIAVGLGTPQEQTLLNAGMSHEQIVTIKLGENPINMLRRGRIDAWFTGIPEARYLWPKDGPKLYMSPVLNSSDIYLACSKQCSTHLVQRLQQAVAKLQHQGLLEKVKQRYLPEY